MADNTQAAQDAVKKEEGRKQEYKLRAGASVLVIEDGDQVSKTDTVMLTEEQAKAFGDKLEGLADPETANTANTTTVVIGTETAGRATIQEGAAAASPQDNLGEGNVANTTNTDAVETPNGQPIGEVQNLAPAENASSTDGGKVEGGGNPGVTGSGGARATAPAAGANSKQADAKAGAGNSQNKS
jgi:hypothetical protein